MRMGVARFRLFRGQVRGSASRCRSRTLEPPTALARGSVSLPSSPVAGLAMPPTCGWSHRRQAPGCTRLHSTHGASSFPAQPRPLMLQGAWDTVGGGDGEGEGEGLRISVL